MCPLKPTIKIEISFILHVAKIYGNDCINFVRMPNSAFMYTIIVDVLHMATYKCNKNIMDVFDKSGFGFVYLQFISYYYFLPCIMNLTWSDISCEILKCFNGRMISNIFICNSAYSAKQQPAWDRFQQHICTPWHFPTQIWLIFYILCIEWNVCAHWLV